MRDQTHVFLGAELHYAKKMYKKSPEKENNYKLIKKGEGKQHCGSTIKVGLNLLRC